MTEKKTYTYEEVYKASLEYFNGDELAADVFADKYALNDGKGNYYELTPADMHHRLAKEFARIEAKYPNAMTEEEIFSYLDKFKYIVPQGSPMSAIGNPFQIQTLGNCYVLEPPYDSYGGIMKSDQELAQLMKRRAGVGLSLDNIRPKGISTNNAAKTTDGIAVFMERFSNTCREVAQSGRRGAEIQMLSVHHPEIETFINIKRDKTKVTGANISVKLTDEFMQAVKNNQDYEQRWPVDSLNPKFARKINARKIWNQIIEAAWESAEPGLFFIDNQQKNTPADIYSVINNDWKSTATNPCLTYDVKVAVADGRGYVEIGKLAEEGVDVPVYSYDENTNKIIIKTMRNPRITGYDKDVYKITLDDGSSFKATSNHKIYLNDGFYKEVKDLVPGDSLFLLTKFEAPLDTIIGKNAINKKNNDKDYVWLSLADTKRAKSEHRYIAEFYHGEIPKHYVVHHKDFNSKNNHFSNLEIIHKDDHNALHAEKMRDENNPIFKIKADPVRFAKYSAKMSESCSGIKNGNAKSKVSIANIKNHALTLTKNLGRKFGWDEWATYASHNNMPQSFSNWRQSEIGTVDDLATWAASKLGFENNIDAKNAKTLLLATEQGYKAYIDAGRIFVDKICEYCKSNFSTLYKTREIAFCSNSCANKYQHEEKAKNSRKNQLRIYTDLKFKLGREPLLKEWESECKNNKIPFRLKTKNGFESWKQLKNESLSFNHRVVSIEYVGKENVYNGTVDDTHNFFMGGWEGRQENGKRQWFSILNRNCGEIGMGVDSCRLLLINLISFVKNPFTKDAEFDYNTFADVAVKAQRLMDDIVDLELECMDKIIKKIESDPEPEEVKAIELNLWKRLKKNCIDGRRTGLGITALGDTLAAMNIRYGSEKSIQTTEKIYKTLCLNAYKSTCIMAKERGAFPIYNHELEKNHPYLSRIRKEIDTESYNLYCQFGRRNIALTTTAPAGSVSCLTQTTSGIEPAFLLKYDRYKKVNPGDPNVRIDRVDALGDSWEKYTVYHKGFQTWMSITKETDVKKSPYYKATSNDIDWKASVSLQAKAQFWVCHSLSKTCNIPKNSPKELVAEIYMRAWEEGCKGFTVYRDGCRDGVLVSSEEKETKPETTDKRFAPPRSKTLQSETHKIKIDSGDGELKNAYITVSFFEDTKDPYEVFINAPTGNDAKDAQILELTSRMTSLALRHGVPVEFITNQLSKVDGQYIYSIPTSLAKILMGYIETNDNKEQVLKLPKEKQEENVLVEKDPKTCKHENKVYSEGCFRCLDCSFSGCG